MQPALFLNSLRDPMGLPFYPVVFQALLVLTFALHIFLVNIVIGSLLLSIWGRCNREDYLRQLSRSLAKVATIATSVAVVLGVAPLLFVQVIYDPIWYSANLLSAWWAMLFLLLIMLGFLSAYGLYLCHKHPRSSLASGLSSISCIVIAGAIMHMLNMESLFPEQWSTWFAGSGQLATGGWAFKAFSTPRYLHFLLPAVINIGVMLMLSSWYFNRRPLSSSQYLDWQARLGCRLTRYGLLLQSAIGLWWLLTLPGGLRFLLHPGLHFGLTIALATTLAMFWSTAAPLRRAPLTATLSLLAILAMSVTREALRMAHLERHNYSIYTYPANVDWGSTLLFFITLLVGLIVIVYPLVVAFKAGRGQLV